jgi:hypothetical protein
MKVHGYLAAVAGAALGLTFATPASAAYIINFQDVGSNVVATGSGSLNVTALALFAGSSGGQAEVRPDFASVVVGPTTLTSSDLYSGFAGPTSFGPGIGGRNADLGSGPLFGVIRSTGFVVVPNNYVSGTDLGTSTARYNNITTAGLGLAPGRYVYTWGSGPTADTFTVVVAPEPTAIAFAGVIAVGLLGRRKRS